jgi:hypothetical protein
MSIHDQMDKEEERLHNDLAAGRITRKEFDEGMRDLRAEMRQYAQDQADDAYNNAMGGW